MKKIKKGDEVIIISGKDKGRKGVVLAVLKDEKLQIEGINAVKKHVKANPNTGDRGGIVIKTLPVHRSNVMLYNPATEKGSRVRIKTFNDGRKVRCYKSTDEVVDV